MTTPYTEPWEGRGGSRLTESDDSPVATATIPYQSPIDETGTLTVFVGIGNSDRRLTAREYAQFIDETRAAIESYMTQLIGEWHSVPGKPWLNAQFAFTIRPGLANYLVDELRRIRGLYRQDAIAWAECPKTEFV